MKKFIRTFISLILVLVLFVLAMPIYALEEVTVKEVEDLREENVKHFDMGDGTYKAVVYSEPVHRKDSEGKWTDIDNTLSEVKENGMTNYATADGRVKFSKNLNNGKIFELKENGYKISFSLLDKDIKEAKADIDNHKTKKSTSVLDSNEKRFEKLKKVDNLTKVRYNDIKKNIDIEYEIYSNNIKESIIVNGKQDAYEYTFELELNKLIAILNDDGSISLTDEETGEEKYVMPSPFMFDDKGELSTDVYYTLIATGRYKYQLKVIASSEWINAEGRAFPVTIDPTIEVTTSYGEAYVSSSNPTTNYKKPSNGKLYVSPTQRTFMKFQLPNLNYDDHIEDATLHIYYYSNTSMGTVTVGAYAVPYSWNENTITWNNSVGAHQTEENATANSGTEDLFTNNGATESNPSMVHIGITSAVRGWYAGKANNGIAIRRISGSNDTIIMKGYNSGENYRAILEFTYQKRSGILDGAYFFRNIEYDTYMQAPAQSETNQVKLYPFDGDMNQRWSFEYLHNGYYKITANDGRALTAPVNNGAILSLTTYNASLNQMWGVTYDVNAEGYRIYPASNHSSYFAGRSNAVSTGRPVELASLQTDNREEWILYEYAPNHSFVTQETNVWCWIACVLNFADCFIDVDCTQSEIAEACQGDHTTIYYTGNSMDMTNALNYIFGSTDLYKMIFRASEENYDHDNHNGDSQIPDRVMLPYNEIEEILSGDNPCPIILGMDGHVVLAYDCYRDQSGELYLLIYDSIQGGPNYKTVKPDDLFGSRNGVDFFLTLYYWNS